jgi:hemin uptake protein HemP
MRGIQQIASAIDIINAPTTTPSLYINQIGNLGIGTTSPSAKLSIQTDLIDTSPALAMYNGSSTPLFYLLNNGNFGIATDTPTNILTIAQGAGNAIADGWSVYSSEEYKTDITYLEEKDYEDILEEIEGMNLARYRWKKDEVRSPTPNNVRSWTPTSAPTSDLNLGVIAEQAPEEVLSKDGKSVSLYDYASYALAGVKALKNEVDELRVLLEANGYLQDSSTLVQGDNGIVIIGENGEKVELRVDQQGYLAVEKIKAKFIETENLKIKAENTMQSGITIYDSGNGQPYCFYIEYGRAMTRPGECSDVLESNGLNSSPPVTPQAEAQNEEVSSNSSDSPQGEEQEDSQEDSSDDSDQARSNSSEDGQVSGQGGQVGSNSSEGSISSNTDSDTEENTSSNTEEEDSQFESEDNQEVIQDGSDADSEEDSQNDNQEAVQSDIENNENEAEAIIESSEISETTE